MIPFTSNIVGGILPLLASEVDVKLRCCEHFKAWSLTPAQRAGGHNQSEPDEASE